MFLNGAYLMVTVSLHTGTRPLNLKAHHVGDTQCDKQDPWLARSLNSFLALHSPHAVAIGS